MFETAYAAEAAAPSLWSTLLPFLFLIAAIYFILIRPQQRRNKQHREMLAALQKGDEVVTIGGVIGRVTRITDDHVMVSVSGSVDIPFQKHAVQTVLPKGTVESLSSSKGKSSAAKEGKEGDAPSGGEKGGK